MEVLQLDRNKIHREKQTMDFSKDLKIAGFQCHAIQNRLIKNKNQNHSIHKVQILRNERR